MTESKFISKFKFVIANFKFSRFIFDFGFNFDFTASSHFTLSLSKGIPSAHFHIITSTNHPIIHITFSPL